MFLARAAAAKTRSSSSVVVACTLAGSSMGYMLVEFTSATNHCTMISTLFAPSAARLSRLAIAPALSRR